jgi:formyltetrahydrofolate synthetase
VVDAASRSNGFDYTYPLEASIQEKIEAIATRIYGAAGVHFLQPAEQSMARFTADGLDRLPVCMAKTHLSLSDDPTLLNAPEGFTLHVRDIRAYTGAGWLVPLCGEIMTMPGLGATAAAFEVDIDEQGRTVGLF